MDLWEVFSIILLLVIVTICFVGMVRFWRKEVVQLNQQIEDLQKDLEVKKIENASLTSEKIKLETLLAVTQQAGEEQKEFFQEQMVNEEARWQKKWEELDKKFQLVSQQVLQAQMPEFLTQTEEKFKQFSLKNQQQMTEKKQEFENLLRPFQELLGQYRQQLKETEDKQIQQFHDICGQIKFLAEQSQTLSQETQQFRRVLHHAATRGRWGEETLKRVVEVTGMSPHCDFTIQDTDGKEQQRPDMVVHLPEERVIIIDAKVPELDIVIDLEEVANESDRQALLKQYVAKVKVMIKDLATRNYPKNYPGSLDYTILFLPAESLFSLALEADPNLISEAARMNVILTSPASLIALLRSVSISWQYFQHTEETRNIVMIAEELYQSFITATGYVTEIGKSLKKTLTSYNQFVGSYDNRVKPRGERLQALLQHYKKVPSLDVLSEEMRSFRQETE